MHFSRLIFQCGMLISNICLILPASKTEYCGRFAAVGYADVEIGLMVQLLPDNSFIASANSYQFVMPALQ